MYKPTLIIFLFFISCTPTEPVEIHDDNAILQLLLNMADSASLGFLKNEFDIDGNGILYCTELPNTLADTVTCEMENGRFTKIKLSNMGLSGLIPQSIGDLTELTHLGLKNNNLTGEIPESIGNLTKLSQLSIATNNLSGSIPDTIGNLKSLTHLALSSNEFSGSIPKSIGELSILHTFLTDSNNLNTIPHEICNIYNTNSNYNLSNNQFCQSLPTCLDTPEQIGFQDCDTSCSTGYENNNGYCYSQTDLSVLDSLIINQDSLNMDLDENKNGEIEPLELGFQEWRAGRLETLDCYLATVSCNLSVFFPENIGTLDSLRILDLQNNNLQGYLTASLIESLVNLSNFVEFNVNGNRFSGYVPENICNIDLVMLEDNHLCPCYPDCLTEAEIGEQDSTGCSVCSDGYTPICGNENENHEGQNNTNPHNFVNFSEESICFKQSNLDILQAFIDSSGSILNMDMDIDSSGTIEEIELGNQYWENGELKSFQASSIGLSGSIPDSIKYWDKIDTLYLHDNQLNGTIPEGICELNLSWYADSSAESTAFLYDNKLCPPYPECIIQYVGVQDTTECPLGE